jgi:hypothetical protein
MKKICLVLITLSLVSMAIVSAQGWYFDPTVDEADIKTTIVNREDGTARITLDIEVDHHVFANIGTQRYLIIAVNETGREGWADKVDLSENGNATYIGN